MSRNSRDYLEDQKKKGESPEAVVDSWESDGAQKGGLNGAIQSLITLIDVNNEIAASGGSKESASFAKAVKRVAKRRACALIREK